MCSRGTWRGGLQKQGGSTLENGTGCSGLGLAATFAFAFCTQRRGQLVPAGCRQKEEGPGVAPGVSTGRKTPCFCHFGNLVIPQTVPSGRRRDVVRCRFVWGWCETSAAHGAAQRHWCSVATLLPALLLRLSVCQSPITAHGQPCGIQRLSASAALAGGLLGCFISGAAAWPVPSRFPGWLCCPPGLVAQDNVAVDCSTSHWFCFPPLQM